jgi:probable HAF family extracellular repeat protein
MINLGLLPGGQYGWTNAVNADGTVVVGQNWMGSDYEAFIWTQAGGMQDLHTVLAAAGIDVSNWTLEEAFGVSADGLAITGTGIGPPPGGGAPTSQAWIARLPSSGPTCYPNCDQSTAPPILNANDFQCFLNKFAVADAYANCDNSTSPPVLNANDFQCFLNKFAVGCS